MNEKRNLELALKARVVIVAAAVCLLVRQAPAATPQQGLADHGTFVLEMAGKEYGTENFSIESTGKVVTAKTESQLRQGEAGQLIQTSSKLVLDGSLDPQSYSWSARGPRKFDLSVDFTSTPIKSQLHRPDGKVDLREFELAKNVLILDNNVILHYQLLVDRFVEAGGGKQTFQAYIPQSATPGALNVQDAGMETVTLGSVQRSLRHLVVIANNAQIDLWVDGGNHLQRLYWSDPKIEALRQP
jgi:hypothetical protein